MKINEYYVKIKDMLIYNIHYAPDYPNEDCTDLAKEYKLIEGSLNELKEKVHSDYKVKQLDFACKKVAEAFTNYQSGNDGRTLLEEALEYLERSKRKAAPSVDFVIDSQGNVSLVHTKEENTY